MMTTYPSKSMRAQVERMDALLYALHEEAWRARPRVGRLRELAEDLAWEFEPIRAAVLDEKPLPDLRPHARKRAHLSK